MDRIRILALWAGSCIFRVLDVVFWLLNPGLRRPLQEVFCESDTWDNDKIIELTKSLPTFTTRCDIELVKISDDTVVKPMHCRSEVLAMNLVRAQTCIPVPRVRRIIEATYDNSEGYSVMDSIKNGKPLHQCWPSLSIWAKLKIVLTMRHYLRQLRRIRHPRSDIPGPPDDGQCEGYQFSEQGRRSFANKEDLVKYYRFLHARSQKYGPYSHVHIPPFDESHFSRLVFTHNSLDMDHILLDDNQRLWIVDWSWAGFFPPWFEHFGMRYGALLYREPYDWLTAIKFMAEPSFEMEMWMEKVGFYYDVIVFCNTKST